MPFTSILCAVDFSQPSYAALEMAMRLVKESGGTLTVLFVEHPLIDAGAAAAGYNVGLLEKSTIAQLERLIVRMSPSGVPRDACRVAVRFGNPAHEILSAARKSRAELIVMGTNGRTGPAKLFFGSVADAVLRRARVPVLVVPRRRLQSGDRHRSVLGALELGPHARGDARRIAQAAPVFGEPLTLVHVVYRATGTPAIAARLDVYYQQQLAAATQRMEPIGRTAGAATHVALGRPEDEIAAAAKRAKAGCIILVLRRGRGIFGKRQGSTTYRVLCASKIPVLALPPA